MENNTNIETLDGELQTIESLNVLSNNQNVNEFEIKNKKKFPKFLLIIGILVLILIGLGLHYLLLINSPKNIFIKFSNLFFESIEKNFKESPEFLEKAYLYEGNIKVNTNIEEITFLNNETLNYSFGLDIKNKKAETEIEFIEGNNKLVNVKTNIKDNNMYIDLDELFEKVIVLDEITVKEKMGKSINELFAELEKLYSDENIEDIRYLITRFKDITNKVLKNINYEKENVQLNIDGKKVSTNKMSLTFNKDNLQISAKTYIEEMLNDDKLIEKIAFLGEIDKNELIETLNNAKEQINSIEEPEEALKISLYTSGIFGNIIKIAIEENEVDKAYFINYKDYKLIAIDDMFIEIKGEKLTITESEEILANGTVNSFEVNNINIDFVSVDNELFKGNFTYINNNSDLDFNFNIEIGLNEKIAIALSFNTTNIGSNKNETKMIVEIMVGGKNLKFTNITKMTADAIITNMNTTNTLNYNNLTEEHMNVITNNLKARLKGTKYGELMNINDESNFITDANKAIEAASHAMSFITIDSNSNYYTIEDTNTYCFTLQNLEDAGYISGYDDYEGTITVTKEGNSYSYRIDMHNDEYYVRTKDVVYEDNLYTTKYMPSTIKTKCNSFYNL